MHKVKVVTAITQFDAPVVSEHRTLNSAIKVGREISKHIKLLRSLQLCNKIIQVQILDSNDNKVYLIGSI